MKLNGVSDHLLEWVHAESLVHAGSVREEGGKSGFEQQTEVHGVIAREVKRWNT